MKRSENGNELENHPQDPGPTVASALGGPLAGAAVAAIGAVLGVPDATWGPDQDIITSGQLTADQVAALRELELKYQNEERRRGFRYNELEFQDRDSARQASVQGRHSAPVVLALAGPSGRDAGI